MLITQLFYKLILYTCLQRLWWKGKAERTNVWSTFMGKIPCCKTVVLFSVAFLLPPPFVVLECCPLLFSGLVLWWEGENSVGLMEWWLSHRPSITRVELTKHSKLVSIPGTWSLIFPSTWPPLARGWETKSPRKADVERTRCQVESDNNFSINWLLLLLSASSIPLILSSTI